MARAIEAEKVAIRICDCGCGNLHLILRTGARRCIAVLDQDEALMIAAQLRKAAEKLPVNTQEGALQ